LNRLAITKGDFVRMVAAIGSVPTEDKEIFWCNGVKATELRDPRSCGLPLLERKGLIISLLRAIRDVVTVGSKVPIISISAGPGIGKTEVVARLVENWSSITEQYGSEIVAWDPTCWLPMAVTFNYKTGRTMDEVTYSVPYRQLIALRLIYTWLVCKQAKPNYNAFISALFRTFASKKDASEWLDALSLTEVVRHIGSLTNRPKIVLFVDESLRPLQQMCAEEQKQSLEIANTADCQNKNFVLVFTNVKLDPFTDPLSLWSGRDIKLQHLYRLSSGASIQLVQSMVAMLSPTLNWDTDTDRQALVECVARWSGGGPRLCEYAAVLLSVPVCPHPTIIMSQMLDGFNEKYNAKIRASRQAVILALMGVTLPPNEVCRLISDHHSVDSLVADGILTRELRHEIYMAPILFSCYCNFTLNMTTAFDLIDMHATSNAISAQVSGSKTSSSSEPTDQLKYQLALELHGLLLCTYPSSDGKQYEYFDRLSQRLKRCVRSQFAADIKNENLVFGQLSTDWTFVRQNSNILQCNFNWRAASLIDIFGPCCVNTVSDRIQRETFDVSEPFSVPDCEFSAIPTHDDRLICSRQYFPKHDNQAGFDWLVVLRSNSNKLYVVATENKYRSCISSTSNKVEYEDDVLFKYHKAVQELGKAGWNQDQIVFRLAAYRYCPKFPQSTLSKVPCNVMVSGPKDVEESMSMSMNGIFCTMREVNSMKYRR
jgi:hypothetical protein